MMRTLSAAACAVALLGPPAAAAPSPDAVAARVAALGTRLRGQGFTITSEGPFVIVGDEPPARVRSRVSFLRMIVTLLEQDYFAEPPAKVIEVWLFKNERSYRRGAKAFFDDEPDTPYGYYSTADDALVMNIGPGAGTLSHELVHPYIEANFPAAPAWFNEGLASLYEQPRERDGHLWGTTNWRLPGLQAMIRGGTLPTLRTVLRTSRDEFYDAPYDGYAYARFLCQYLQDHGQLRAFYQAFAADTRDRTGEAALVRVLGQDLPTIERAFVTWARRLRR